MLPFDVSANPRHLAIYVTSRGPAIERRSDARAGRQQQYGQIRFARIDVGFDDQDHKPSPEERLRVTMARQLDALGGRMRDPVLPCGMRQPG
jgi:hypothetical protein